MEITFGVFPWLPEKPDRAKRYLNSLVEMGATSVQLYVLWKIIEPRRDRFDWSFFDRQVELIARHSFKLVPFLVMGPWYATPRWFQESAESVYTICLEHGRESKVQSIWNPHLPSHVERVVSAMADHYLPQDVLESVIIGISGDFGEAQYQAFGIWPTAYHTHAGYWCGDPYARASFRQHLEERFGSVAALNERWRSKYASFAEVQPFLHRDAPSERAWVDFVSWYQGAMTDWAEFWLKTTTHAFPGVKVYLCVGGDGAPRLGCDYTGQCKLASRYGAGIRITNESDDYLHNFCVTRLVASAGRHYGAFFGFEPAAVTNPRGVVARIYNAAASGADQLHDFIQNYWQDDRPLQPAMEAFKGHKCYLPEKKYHPQVPVAVFFPTTQFVIEEVGLSLRFVALCKLLRGYINFDFIDERMIKDGALARYQYLILLDGEHAERKTLLRIREWVREGGIAVSRVLPADLEGDTTIARQIFGLAEESELRAGYGVATIDEPDFLQHVGQQEPLRTVYSWAPLAEGVRVAASLHVRATHSWHGTDDCLAVGDAAPLPEPLLDTAVIWANPFGKGWGIFYSGPFEMDTDVSLMYLGNREAFIHLVRDCLYHFSAIDGTRPDLKPVEGAAPGVYATEIEGGRVLWLNTTPEEKAIGPNGIRISPHSIAFTP